ncbi:MAG: HEPN domain-containing protein [Clostridiales bacterium]|nr:HEPN domain-containing protein [Clostridiales bacterium]
MEPNANLEWFRYADMDLLSAEHLILHHPVHIHLVCFLCQQTAEKNLKGFLLYHKNEEPPKIHNLDILCDTCSALDSRFEQIYVPCEKLTNYGVQPRYPNEMEITENDMNNALMYAKQIAEFEPLLAVRKSLEQNL